MIRPGASVAVRRSSALSLLCRRTPLILSLHNNIQPSRAYVGTPNMSSIGIKSVSDAIKHDHRELEDYYNRIVNSKDPDEQVRYQNQFIWELARHSIAEELVVYPALEKHAKNGKAVAQKDREEHQKVKEKLYEFQKLDPQSVEFLPLLNSLMKDLAQHIKEEEKQDLVALEGAIDGATSESMARSFQRTKHFVPTQSHPSAPDKPPFETVVGLLSAPLDKLMDLFKKFPKV